MMMHARSVLMSFAVAVAVGTASAAPDPHGFDWVTIGDVGNRGYDRQDIGPQDVTGRGVVDYAYRIGRTEVTTAQYIPFLNTVFKGQGTNIVNLTLWEPRHIGATADVVDGDIVWSQRPGEELRPVFGMSFVHAAAFCNWMHNGMQNDRSTIFSGAYDILTYMDNDPYNDQVARSPGARYFIPNFDEYLKAAHYDPNKANADGSKGGWWYWNNGSDTRPVTGLPGEPGAQTPAGLGLPEHEAVLIPLMSYPDATSAYGLMDLSGGTYEWVEDPIYSAIDPNAIFGRLVDGAPSLAGSDYFDSDTSNSDAAEWYTGGEQTLIGEFHHGLRVAGVIPSPSVCCAVLIFCSFRMAKRRQS